ncbi:hypothetical protein MCC02032_07580 [Bifidobacteriaceae bacterium MCC02032]|nr:hypothetical protein MCC02032_07580 [Bifidobacteriaceae bacterium MCC02032]
MIPPRTQIKAPSRRLHTLLDILLMEGDRAPEAFILEIQPFTPVFSLSENNIRPLRTARLEASQGEFFDEAP